MSSTYCLQTRLHADQVVAQEDGLGAGGRELPGLFERGRQCRAQHVDVLLRGFLQQQVEARLDLGHVGPHERPQSQRHREVERTDVDHVHALDREDLVDVVEEFAVLGQRNDHRILVALLDVGLPVERAGAIVGGAHVARGAADAPRRELGKPDRLQGVGGATDVRNAHRVGPELERVADHVLVVALDAHDRGKPGIVGRPNDVLELRIDAERGVLAIDEDEVEPGVPDDLHDREALRVVAHPEDRPVAGQRLAQLVDSHAASSFTCFQSTSSAESGRLRSDRRRPSP